MKLLLISLGLVTLAGQIFCQQSVVAPSEINQNNEVPAAGVAQQIEEPSQSEEKKLSKRSHGWGHSGWPEYSYGWPWPGWGHGLGHGWGGHHGAYGGWGGHGEGWYGGWYGGHGWPWWYGGHGHGGWHGKW